MERNRTARRLGFRLSDSVSDTGPQNVHFHRSKVQVGPGQRDHPRSTETSAADQQDHGAITDREMPHQLLKLVGGENVFVAEPLLRASYSTDRIECQPFIADCMGCTAPTECTSVSPSRLAPIEENAAIPRFPLYEWRSAGNGPIEVRCNA